tara:strand:+ start:2530 stop:2763 length:234 start_codon:yes stop_codon:yes gene_type:complete
MDKFQKWDQQYAEWAKSQRIEGILPDKPYGFDEWKQGDDPLNLASAPKTSCKGGDLVDSAEWGKQRRGQNKTEQDGR